MANDLMRIMLLQFEVDYAEFRRQCDALHAKLQCTMDAWFQKSLTVMYHSFYA